MLKSLDLLNQASMPQWSEISLSLYKEFSEIYLIPTTFRYYLENGTSLDVRFTEEGIYHLLGIQHINGKISKMNFFEEIHAGLDFNYFMIDKKMKKRFNDFKHRIRLFSCIYQVMCDQQLFYVPDHHIADTSVLVDYVKYSLIDQKGEARHATENQNKL